MISGNADTVFIVWAYAGVGLVTLGIIGYVALASFRVKRRLAALDAQGIRRRSGGAAA